MHCHTLAAAAVVVADAVAADAAVAAADGYIAHCCFVMEGTGYSSCCYCYYFLLLYLDMMNLMNYNARIVLLIVR